MSVQEELVLNVIERLTKIHKIQKLYMLLKVYSWFSLNPLKLWKVLVVFVVSLLTSHRCLVHGKWMPRYKYRGDPKRSLVRGDSFHTVFFFTYRSVTHRLNNPKSCNYFQITAFYLIFAKIFALFHIGLLLYQSHFFSFFICALLPWFVVKC